MTTPTKRSFHILAKPAGADCNIDCKYCFYLSRSELHASKNPRMSFLVMESFLQQYLDSQPDGPVHIAWQGGEPTLMGLDFFERACTAAHRYKRDEQTLEFTIQTNGLLIDDAWIAHFLEHDYLVGLSIDGPAEMHDKYRVGKTGATTHSEVLKAAKLMADAGVRVNALATINSANADNPVEVYRFLRDEVRASYIQLIPIVEREGDGVSRATVRPAQFGKFLNGVFDEWLKNDLGSVSVGWFEATLGSMLGERAGICISEQTCGADLALEANGDLYSCDHFVDADNRLGNIQETPLAELATNAQQTAFGLKKYDQLPEICKGCRVKGACHGGCPKDWFGDQGQNYLCEGLLSYYTHAAPAVANLAERIKKNEARGSQTKEN